MSHLIPNRSSTSSAAASPISAAASISLPPLPSTVRVEHRGRSHGRVLVATRSFAAGEVILQEAPLVAVPPFDARVEWTAAAAGAISSKGQKARGWACVESLCKSLRFEDDALVLYRAVLLYYLLFLSGPARASAQHSRAIAQRIIELYDPARTNALAEVEEDEEGISVSTSSSSTTTTRASRAAAHRARTLSALSSSLRTDAGRSSLESLFACVSAQAIASLGVPVVNVSLHPQSGSGSSEAAAGWDEGHFLSHILPLADIFNGSNMDCIVAPLPAEATAASSGSENSGATRFTALYDALSRLNHDCLPNCVHYLEQEEAYTAGKGLEQLADLALTPQQLVVPAAAAAVAVAASSSAAAPSNAARPFVRTLRALCPISPGDELSISYLSPQLLCQSTPRRQAWLRREWHFLCRCARCLSVDTARALNCPTCKTGSILMQCMRPAESAEESPEDAAESEAPFSFVSSCDCVLTAAQSQQLLKDESQVEAEWARFQSDLPRCTQPVQLCALIASLLRRNGVSDSHYLSFEFRIVLRDLQRVLNKPLEEMEHAKFLIWYCERVAARGAVQRQSDRDSGDAAGSGEHSTGVLAEIARCNASGKIWGSFTQSGLLIDTESRAYIPPSLRVASLAVSTELSDAWLAFSDLLWSIHARQTDDLARMLIQRAVYFLVCGSIAVSMLSAEGSALRRSVDTKMQQRVQIARAKGVDLSKIIEEKPATLPASTTDTAASAATAASSSLLLSCHSPVCPHHAFSSVRPPALLQCTRCKSVRYCSRDCQKVDWTMHKKVCKAPAAEQN